MDFAGNLYGNHKREQKNNGENRDYKCFWLLAVPHYPLAEFQEERVDFVPVNALSWDTRELDSALLKIRTALNSGFLFPIIVPLFLES